MKKYRKKINEYGYIISIYQLGGSILLVSGLITLIGILYQLPIPYVMFMILITYGFYPTWLLDFYKRKYENHRFTDAEIYMEQMLYTFGRQQKILATLEDVAPIFPKGKMHVAIEAAIQTILYDYDSVDSAKKGMSIIEEAYSNERLAGMHRFMQKVEDIGGDYKASITLLLKDKEVWVKQTKAYQEDCKKAKRNVCIAIAISLGICMVTNLIIPKSIAISQTLIYRISVCMLIFLELLVFTKMDHMLSVNWLERTSEMKEKEICKKYECVIHYDKAKEQRKSILWALAPLLLFFIFLFISNKVGIIVSLILVIFMLFQHKIGHIMATKSIQKEIEKAYPQWLLEISLWLQTDNVQVSLSKTLDTSPAVLQPELRRLMEQLKDNPESVQPYLTFLEEFHLPDIQAAMKMLYSISVGNNDEASVQIEELISRNHTLMNRAEILENEDSLAGIYLLFLAPAMTGAMKLIVDMTLFLVVFLGQVSIR